MGLTFYGSRSADCRLGQSNNSYRADNHLGDGKSDVTVGLGYAEDQIPHVDDAVGESDFRLIKGVKWQIPVFDVKTTSWRHFEMEFLMAMPYPRLNSVLAGDKNETPVADRTMSRDRLHAH